MPIDRSQALAAEIEPTEYTWEQDDIILYALGLGVGVGVDQTDKKKVLQYTYENGLKSLPTYGVMPIFKSVAKILSAPGMSFNPMMLLHGEQRLELAKPIPTSATVVNEATISGIYDKGKGALVTVDIETKDKESGELLFSNVMSSFIRGEGGFGQEGDDPAPEPAAAPPEDREPDHVVEYPTMTHQAILYRLSGDKNPLHIDPAMAQMGNFDKPILHGLCTFGNVGRAVIEACCDNDPEKFKSIQARFTSPVYPGETIVTKIWKESDTAFCVAAYVKERDMLNVINNCRIELFG